MNVILFSNSYINRHQLGSLGGVQGAFKRLLELDYVEIVSDTHQVVDPIFREWLAEEGR